MSQASADLLLAQDISKDRVDLVVPHQANLRIIEAVAKRLELPMDRVFVNVHRYGNMSAATVAVALVEAVEEGRIKPGALLLLPAFGAGLTWCAHLVRWGERVTALSESDADLAPAAHTALELVQTLMSQRRLTAS
jgi:3-oxoacyl-[acyl-carrier-protein] synthase-3